MYCSYSSILASFAVCSIEKIDVTIQIDAILSGMQTNGKYCTMGMWMSRSEWDPSYRWLKTKMAAPSVGCHCAV